MKKLGPIAICLVLALGCGGGSGDGSSVPGRSFAGTWTYRASVDTTVWCEGTATIVQTSASVSRANITVNAADAPCYDSAGADAGSYRAGAADGYVSGAVVHLPFNSVTGSYHASWTWDGTYTSGPDVGDGLAHGTMAGSQVGRPTTTFTISR